MPASSHPVPRWWFRAASVASLVFAAITWVTHKDSSTWMWGALGLAFAAVTALHGHDRAAHRTIAASALALVLASWLPLPGFWPVFQVVILALPVAVVAFDDEGRRARASWWSRGQLRGAPIVALGGVAGVSLWLWWSVMQPDLSAQLAMVPTWPWPWLLLAGLVFSAINALLEELLFRGLLQGALQATMRPWAAIVIQGLLFGLVHWHGFPQGPLGALMAGTWAVGLGWMRHAYGGLLTPYIAHIAADCVIFAIVAFLRGS